MHAYKTYHNYDLHPATVIQGFDTEAFEGKAAIEEAVRKRISEAGGGKTIVSFDLYPAATKEKILELAAGLSPSQIIDVERAAKTEQERMKEFEDFITDDRVFGVICHKKVESLYDEDKVRALRKRIREAEGLVVLVGFGTELFAKADVHILCDLSRWEIQLRYRGGIGNWNCSNTDDPVLTKYKIGYFIEWRLADRYKKQYFESADFVIDANDDDNLKMISGDAFRAGLKSVAGRPFRLEPYFDPGVWGGKWMQHTLGAGTEEKNLAWSFDGVPEENAINLTFGSVTMKLPAMDLTLYCPEKLLGGRVHARYGAEYPIRFDFLDTVEGGNLSLQVHPLTEYIQAEFGMHYTQDESYYILDTDDEAEDTYVYLGLKNGVDREQMAEDLRKAKRGEIAFPAERYVNKIPVKKHDHILIPAGTVHCSGKGCMVLEISATPYIFTFKLWDWGRIGLDGLPRPIHVEHGLRNIQWDRNADFVSRELIHQETTLENHDGCLAERTGLHAKEPLESIRYSLSEAKRVECDDSVVQGNLVEGESALIESTDGRFEPFEIHYAETFIVPAAVGSFLIVPVKEPVKVMIVSVRR